MPLPNGIEPVDCAAESADVLLAAAVLNPETRRELIWLWSNAATRYSDKYRDLDAADLCRAVSNLLARIDAIEKRRNRSRGGSCKVEPDTRPAPAVADMSQENIDALAVEYAAIALDEVEVS
jgi:hypothetical protein